MNSYGTLQSTNGAFTPPSLSFTTGQVASADGTRIGYRQVGKGPGVVILHGGMRASHHYTKLAEALADAFTVILPDRRGRGLSGPPGDDYSIEKEMEDVSAILTKTGAGQVFGHSGGGFFALEAALRLPIRKLALYEPAVPIDGSMPLDWLPKLEQALAQNDPAAGFVHVFKGLRLHSLGRLPGWVLVPFVRLMLREKEGREIAVLLPTMAREAREIQLLEQFGQTYLRFRTIGAQALLLSGSKSPAYLRDAARILAQTVPLGKHIELAGLDHNAPDENAPEIIAAELKAFFKEKA